MREVRKKYTVSDIVLLSWDSKQKSYNLTQMHKKHTGGTSTTIQSGLKNNPNNITETDSHYLMPQDLNNGVAIPKKFFNDKGEMDLRLATGPEACNYLRALGLDLPPVFRM